VTLAGRVWKFGDHVNTDLIMPIRTISLPRRERPRWAFSASRPGWASEVRPGDVIVAGENFGTGSSRPAAEVLKDLGIACVLAETINGLFFRNCVNYALPALEVRGVVAAVAEGEEVEVLFESGVVRNRSRRTELRGEPWPPMLLDVLSAGGLVPLLEKKGLLLAE
jgi:3-isopropylmalate/(R)-2-methylmalate dehydratase small subunit